MFREVANIQVGFIHKIPFSASFYLSYFFSGSCVLLRLILLFQEELLVLLGMLAELRDTGRLIDSLHLLTVSVNHHVVIVQFQIPYFSL